MEQVFIFDVEGPLAPLHGCMDAGFARFFRAFIARHPVYLVSTSGFAGIERQVPQDIFDACSGVFANNGAELAMRGAIVYSKHHEFHPMVRLACEHFVDTTWFALRRGGHIDETPGTLHVSSIGRNAKAGERRQFIAAINASGLGYRGQICGEIGVRISPAGWDSAVVRNEVLRRHPAGALHYHAAGIAGNPLATALRKPGDAHTVVQAQAYARTWSDLVHFQKHRFTQREGAERSVTGMADPT